MRLIQLSIRLLLGLFTLSFLAGCWDLTEINRSSLMTGIAIEPGVNKKNKVTYEVLNTPEAQAIQGGRGGSPTSLYASEGDSVAETAGKLNEKEERLLITSHTRVIIIDERTAREGLDPFMDILQRSRFIREDVPILISNQIPASRLLGIIYPAGMYASFKIQSQVENFYKTWAGVPRGRLFDATQALLTEGQELMLGAVTVVGDVDKSENVDTIKSSVPDAFVRITGSAVFRKDKLLGFISTSDTRWANLVRDEVSSTSFSIPMSKQDKFLTMRYHHRDTDVKVMMRQGTPYVTVNIRGEGQIVSLEEDVPIDQVSGYQQLEKLSQAYINRQIKDSIERMQNNYGVDIYGFGKNLYRHHYRQYKQLKQDWNSYFVKANITVTSDISITNSDLKSKRLEPSTP